MFSTWDLVRPTFWHPMSSLEQSMMELDHMSDFMMRSRFPFDMEREMLAASSSMEDDDFFRDLPTNARKQSSPTKSSAKAPATKSKKSTEEESAPDNDRNKSEASSTIIKDNHNDNNLSGNSNSSSNSHYRRGFSSYSFSDSSILDDKGRRVTSTRRRYEDSTGRLKAVHEREVEGKRMRTTWNRLHKDDEGQHESIYSGGGSAEEFETLWQQTPFGQAHKNTIKQHGEQQQQQHQQLQDQPKKENKSKEALEDTPMEE
ncbi:hypothetical protein PHYBOEH_005384 [Phytophthora boehmeriae]|uniref:Uncharacterized protein n=1 Tax=Phytophthora boehmeriae TaxID=109152 RepID=A0A8T1WLW4_9STRA|nr:hypothetical protein PHYBOEH_005384 [Phytophthora boehmeriae]